MVLHCSIHYKEEILYEQSDIKKPSLPILAKTSVTLFLPCFQHDKKSGSGTQLLRVYNDKIDVAVSPCTKTELVFQKLKKTQARKVKIHVY